MHKDPYSGTHRGERSPAPGELSGETRKILAVDDDLSTLEFYNSLLSGAGYEVRAAADATSAVMNFIEFRPDLVLLDADIPGGGGEQVFDITRELLDAGRPVIFVTGMPERVSHYAVKRRWVRILRKPVPSGSLLEEISKLISQCGRRE